MKVGSIVREKEGHRDYGNIDHICGEGDDTLVTVTVFGISLPEQMTKKEFDDNYTVVCD